MCTPVLQYDTVSRSRRKLLPLHDKEKRNNNHYYRVIMRPSYRGYQNWITFLTYSIGSKSRVAPTSNGDHRERRTRPTAMALRSNPPRRCWRTISGRDMPGEQRAFSWSAW